MARGLPTGGQGSKIYVLCVEPEEYKHFRPGTRPGGSGPRPGGSVIEVTKKLFTFPAPILSAVFVGSPRANQNCDKQFFPHDTMKMAVLRGFALKMTIFPVSSGKFRVSQGGRRSRFTNN